MKEKPYTIKFVQKNVSPEDSAICFVSEYTTISDMIEYGDKMVGIQNIEHIEVRDSGKCQ